MIEKPAILQNLPQDLRRLTEEQIEAWVKFFAETLPLESEAEPLGLRQRQELAEEQIQKTQDMFSRTSDYNTQDNYRIGFTNAQCLYDICSAAISLKTFPEEEWQGHVAWSQKGHRVA